MNERMFSLGARLSACAGLVRRGCVVADIGSDHAKLPIWLVNNGIAPRAIASDINTGPIESARKNIARYGLNDRITALVADGLTAITPDMAQDIVVAGMGGELIVSILDSAKWLKSPDYRLILQPMSHPERLREWLFESGFQILEELAVSDAGKLYTVICAQYSGRTSEYTDYDIYTGGLAEKHDELSCSFLRRQARQLRISAQGKRLAGDTTEAEKLDFIADKMEVE